MNKEKDCALAFHVGVGSFDAFASVDVKLTILMEKASMFL